MARFETNIIRYIVGYILGIALFLILIPYFLWLVSSADSLIFRSPIIPIQTVNIIIAIPIFMIGTAFVIWSNLFLLMKGKGGPTDIAGVTVTPRTKHLVIEGPYKYTRNPMVFGANTIYLSITIYLNSLGSLIVWALFFLSVVMVVVKAEEKRLMKDFGDEYRRYKENTARVIPFPRKKLKTGKD